MHEVSLCRDLIAMVESALQADPRSSTIEGVRTINLKLGAFAHVQASALEFCFEAVACGTRAQGARLHIERRAAFGLCPHCRGRQPLSERFSACAGCGYFPLSLVEGGELTLESVEVY